MGTKKQVGKPAAKKPKEEPTVSTVADDTSQIGRVFVAKTTSSQQMSAFLSSLSKRTRIIIAIVVLVLAVLIGILAYSLVHTDNKPVGVSDRVIHQNFSALDTGDLNTLLKKTIGVDLQYLKTHDLSADLLQDYAGAYVAAQALQRAGMNDKALEAYAIAETTNSKHFDEQFFQDYAGTALSAHNMGIWKQQMNKLRNFIEHSKMSADDKKTKLEQIDIQMKVVEAENK